MALDPVTTGIAKSAVSAAIKPTTDFLRKQVARRGAPFADLRALAGADKELDEAISVLRGRSSSLPATLLTKLKGILSDRPSSFSDEEARQFIEDDRVADLVRSGARRTVRGEDIDEERATARLLHSEMFGEEGIYGEGLIEDGIAFAALTLIARLTPADRQTIELIADMRDEMRESFSQIFDRFEAISAGAGSVPLDAAPFDEMIRTEIGRLQRRRMLPNDSLPDIAVSLCNRVDTSLRLASPEIRSMAYREAAVLLIRADRIAEALPWIAKAEALGADVTCERARIVMAEGRFDDALRMLRDRSDALSRGLLLDAIARRDGDDAALAYLTDHFRPADLTGHALQVSSTRMMLGGRRLDAAALLDQGTDAQIRDNPVLLYLRARHSMARAVPPDVGERLMQNEGLLPRASDFHDDATGRRILEEAQADLERLTIILPELEADDFTNLVDINLSALKLVSSDEKTRELAHATFAKRLEDPAQAILLAPLARQYQVEIDWTPLKATLAAAEQLGGLDDIQLRAAFAIMMDEGAPSAVAEFVGRHRDRLETYATNESIVAIQIEALAKAGQLDEARRLLEAERTTVGESTAKFLETTFAELEGLDTVQPRLEQFEASGSTHDLEVLVAIMGQRGDPRLGDYLARLWRLRRQAGDAQRACDVMIQAGDERAAELFLDELGEEARGDGALRTHLAWARYRQGRLADAEAELNALRHSGIDDANTRHLTVLLAIETGRWSELEPFVQTQLSCRDHRTAAELIATARIARSIRSRTTFDLLRAAMAKDPSDARIAVQAYSIATEAGLERSTEVGRWFAVAIADKERSGLVEKTDLNELVEIMTSSRAEADRIGGLINSAEVPMFMGIGVLGGTQSALVIRQLRANAKEMDSRRRSVVPLFAGNRMARHDLSPKAISLDPLSILLLEQLGLLGIVIDAFEDVVLPSGTLHSFFEDQGKASHSQPSRVVQAKRIRDAVADGTLKIVERASASAGGDVDPEFSSLFAQAEEMDGYVIDTAPLHPPGRLDVSTDPSAYAHRLLSPKGLVCALHAAGSISRTVASAAENEIAGSGGRFPTEAVPERGKPLFLANIAVQYLSDADLLHDLKAHAGALFTTRETTDLADAEIANGAAADEVNAGIERIRAILARALSEGRARVGPARRLKDEIDREDKSGSQIIRMSPVVSVLRDAAGIDAFVCDDRSMNKYPESSDRSGKTFAFLTTGDLLGILRARGAIDDDRVDAAREHLRRSGVGMVLVDPEEMRRAVQSSNWDIGPNAELRAIRDSVHLPIARKVLQLPEERPWLRAAFLTISYAIRNAWIDAASDDQAERAIRFLFGMLPDAAALSADDPSPDRQAWISDLYRTFAWAVAAMFDLPDGRTDRHRTWFDNDVRSMVEQRDPGAIEAVAKALYGSMIAPLEVDDASD